MFRFFKKDKEKGKKQGSVRKTEVETDSEQPLQAEKLKIPLVEPIPWDPQQITSGSRLRFSERPEYNLALLAQRIPEGKLVCEQFSIGSMSRRQVAMVYARDLANRGIVAEIRTRIRNIRAVSLLDSSYIERNIEDSGMSPFPQVEKTMKPDVAESAILKGRVAIITEGVPEVILAPTVFFDLLDVRNDAYMRWPLAGSFVRLARFIMFLFAVSLPGFYISLTSYNPEMIPTELLELIMASAEETAFPIYFDAFLMMGVVEAVRMMMVQMPTQLGSTVALFAGLTLVGAGVASNIVGAQMVIIVTLAMISSYGIPSPDLRLGVRLLQFFTMAMSTFLGLFGFAAAAFYILIHLATLKSFGIPYMAPLAPLEASGWGHTILRTNTVDMPQDETYKPQSGQGGLKTKNGDLNE